MLLMASGTFCQDTANIWQILGYVVNVIKIVIPLVLIILGMLDLGKAVVANDDKQINKSVTTLVKRFIAAVVMFFIPTIISAIFNMVLGINLKEEGSDSNICIQCVVNVNGQIAGTNKTCSDYASAALGVTNN